MNLHDTYTQLKTKHPNALIIMKMGDFYELFDEDATVAGRILELTITSRRLEGAPHTPMVGFPYHQLDRYVDILRKAGHEVVMYGQTAEPKFSKKRTQK